MASRIDAATAVPGAHLIDPTVLCPDRESRAARQGRGRWVHQRPAPGAAPWRVDGFRRTSRVHARRRHPADRLAAVCPHAIATTSRNTRPTPTRISRVILDVSSRCATARTQSRPRVQAEYGVYLARLPGVFLEPAARSGRVGDDRQRHRRLRAAVVEASSRLLLTTRSTRIEEQGRGDDGRAPRHRADPAGRRSSNCRRLFAAEASSR